MKKFEKFSVMMSLIDELKRQGSWCGETHVQKATYLAQDLLKVPFGFDFILYKHGPFSFDVTDQLTAMRAEDLIRLQVQDKRYGPTLVPTEAAYRMVADYRDTVGQYRAKLAFVAKSFGNKGVTELERLSTAYFVTREMGIESPSSDRAKKVNKIKPHISEAEALIAIDAVDKMAREAEAIA